MTNPSTPRWVGKTQAVLSTNERPRNWPCDLFSANHKARFHHFKSCKGSPLLKFAVEVCHWDLSKMGKYLAHIDKTDKLQIIRDVFHPGTVLNRSPYSTNPTHIWQTPSEKVTSTVGIVPIFDKTDKPFTFEECWGLSAFVKYGDYSLTLLTNHMGWSLSLGFVEYGPLFNTVPWWNTSRIMTI